MSWIDRYAEFMSRERSPGAASVNRRYMDPDYLTPDVFYELDEVRGRQILRKYNKSSGRPVYAGTYRILYKTEDMEQLCLIMKRIRDEWPVPPQYVDESELARDTFIVARYYPGTHGRIYLKGLGEGAVGRIVARYEAKFRKKLR